MVLFAPYIIICPMHEETCPDWQPTTFGEIKLPPPDLLFIACSIMKLAPCRHFVCFFPQVLCRHRYLWGVLCPAMYRYDLQVAKACQWEEITNAACCFRHHDRARTSRSGGGRISHESQMQPECCFFTVYIVHLNILPNRPHQNSDKCHASILADYDR